MCGRGVEGRPRARTRGLAAPFNALPATPAPAGISLTISGSETRPFKGTVVLSSAVGDGDALADAVTIDVAAARTTPNIVISVDLVANAFVRSTGSFPTERSEGTRLNS